jgi:hypothetical protein
MRLAMWLSMTDVPTRTPSPPGATMASGREGDGRTVGRSIRPAEEALWGGGGKSCRRPREPVPSYRQRRLPNAMPPPAIAAGRGPCTASGRRGRAELGRMAYLRGASAARPRQGQGNLPAPGHDDDARARPAPTSRSRSRRPAGQRWTAGGFGKRARRPRARSQFRAGFGGTSAASLAAYYNDRRMA